MMPSVAQSAQLAFKREPLVLRRSREQVRDYVIHKFDQDLPPRELSGLEAALHRFGLIPDPMQLRPTMIDLLTEQIAGYYDADSNALYIPADIEPSQLRNVVSHELVHALQDQYVSLDSIITQQGHNDRRSAAQAVLEGQATVVQISVLMPEQRPDTYPVGWFWQQRVVAARLQGQMAQFSRAPLWLREGLIFPYLGGADFIMWFRHNRPGRSVLTAMPTSTEQILHPDRYAEGGVRGRVGLVHGVGRRGGGGPVFDGAGARVGQAALRAALRGEAADHRWTTGRAARGRARGVERLDAPPPGEDQGHSRLNT